MLTLAGHLFGCLLWGTLAALALTVLCVVVARGIRGNGVRVILAVIILPLLMWQTVRGVGAVYARSYIVDVEEYVASLQNEYGDFDMSDVAEAVHSRFPAIPDNVIRQISGADDTAGNTALAAAESMRSSLNSYLWARVGWSFLIAVLGTVMLVLTAGNSRRRRSSYSGSRLARSHYLEDLE